MLSQFSCRRALFRVSVIEDVQYDTGNNDSKARLHREALISEVIRKGRQNNVFRHWWWEFRLIQLEFIVSQTRHYYGRNTRAYFEHHRDRLITNPRSLTSPHLQNDTPNTPDVNLEVVPFLLGIDNLRCHPKDRALHGRECTAADIVCPLRDSKVRYLTNSRCFDKNIVCFQILEAGYQQMCIFIQKVAYPMENTSGVKVFQTAKNLPSE